TAMTRSMRVPWATEANRGYEETGCHHIGIIEERSRRAGAKRVPARGPVLDRHRATGPRGCGPVLRWALRVGVRGPDALRRPRQLLHGPAPWPRCRRHRLPA